MGQLFFKKPLQTAILAGSKVTTIRRWDRPRVRAGGRAWAPGVGWLAIDSVETIAIRDLTRDDAAADGFATLSALRQTLRACYPNVRADGKRWYRVRFRLEALATP